MKNRKFYCYLTPIEGGADREISVTALNYGEAEGLVSKYLGDGEFISRIEQEFPSNE